MKNNAPVKTETVEISQMLHKPLAMQEFVRRIGILTGSQEKPRTPDLRHGLGFTRGDCVEMSWRKKQVVEHIKRSSLTNLFRISCFKE